MTSGGGRRRSGVLIAKGFTKIVPSPCDSSTIGAILGGVPGIIISSSSLFFIGLDIIRRFAAFSILFVIYSAALVFIIDRFDILL